MKEINLKIKNGIIKHKNYLIVFGCVFVLFNLMLIISGIFPYGNNTVLFSDSFAQIAPFFEHIFRFLKGEASLFYYNGLAGGTEILSTIIYMFLNPFYIVLLPFGKANIMEAFSLVLFLIFVFNAFVFLWFSNKYFKKLKFHIRILLTLIFTFSGYICFNYGFITWLIYPGITLFLIDAFLKLVNDKKIARFIVFLVWFVVTSFGVGVSSNIILVLLFFGYIFFTKEKKERGAICLRLLIAYIAAILVSLVLLAPAVFAMLNSSRNSELMANLFAVSEYNLIQNKFAGLFMETAVAVFAVCYLIKCNKKENINKFYFFALAVVFVPVIFDVCQKLICGSIYLSFAFRFSFISTILLFILAMKYFEGLDERLSEKEEIKSGAIFKFLNIFILSIFVLGLIFFEIMAGRNASGTIKNPNTTGHASLLYFCITALFAICLVFPRIGIWRKFLSVKMFKATITAMLSITLLFNFCGMSLNTADNCKELKKAMNFVSSQNLSGNLKLFNLDSKYYQINSGLYGLNVSDYFSSLISQETINSFDAIGYFSGITSIEVKNGTLIADSLVGNNFYLTSKPQDRPYLSLIAEKDGLYLYKNELATTGAVMLPEGFEFDKNKTSFENFQTLAESFGIENEMLFNDANIKVISTKYDEKNKIYVQKISFTAEIDCILQINSTLRYGVLEDNEWKDKLIGDGEYVVADAADGIEATDIGFVRAGETKEISICFFEEKDAQTFKFSTLNYSAASQLCEKLQENQVELTRTKTGYVVKGSLESAGRLFVSSPNIKGMSYLSEGEEISTIKAIGDFACFDLSDGEFEIVASYNYPYTKAWIIIAAVCLVIFVVLMLLYKYTNLSILNKPAYITMLVLCGLDLLVFYAIGIVLSIIYIVMCLI